VGTCAISGGVAGLGDRHDIREHFLAHTNQGRVPRMLPKCSPIDTEVKVDYYLPGCPPVPSLYVRLLNDPESLKTTSIVCKECGRRKPKDIRPDTLVDVMHKDVDHDLCLVKQGQLCVGTSTRNGCGAICPRAGFPCVGCRGPSNNLIEKDANAWFESLIHVFQRMTDIDSGEISAALKAPHFALFLFQFSDYSGTELESRPKEKVL
jgi:F420-non-reducing hydrogenase small subunit